MQKLKGALGAVQVILGYRVSPGRELSWAQGVVAESRHAQDRDSQACSFSCGLQLEGACMSAVKLLNLAESGFLLWLCIQKGQDGKSPHLGLLPTSNRLARLILGPEAAQVT